MFITLSEYGTSIAITAFKDVKVSDPEESLRRMRENARELSVQLFDADRIAGIDHLLFAAINALNAFKTKRNISRSLAVETLIYASTQRQIQNAIELVGVTPQTDRLAIVAFGDEPSLRNFDERFKSILGGTTDGKILDSWSVAKMKLIKKLYKIAEPELAAVRRRGEPLHEALKRIIIERMAVLVTRI